MRIGINCGHTVSGQPGCGAVDFIDESVETRTVGRKVEILLQLAGHRVYDCTNDYAPSASSNLSQIIELANGQPLDLFVSIHFNSGGGQGCEVFTYGGNSFNEAENVCRKLNALGFKNRGIKDGSNLYVVRRSMAKAMLIEVCFVDSKSDTDLYNKLGPDVIAQAICDAITGNSAEYKDEEELSMTQYDELKKEIQALKPMVYNFIDDNMRKDASWAIPSIQKLMDNGVLVGNEKGELGLTMDMLKIISILDRSGAFDR